MAEDFDRILDELASVTSARQATPSEILPGKALYTVVGYAALYDPDNARAKT